MVGERLANKRDAARLLDLTMGSSEMERQRNMLTQWGEDEQNSEHGKCHRSEKWLPHQGNRQEKEKAEGRICGLRGLRGMSVVTVVCHCSERDRTQHASFPLCSSPEPAFLCHFGTYSDHVTLPCDLILHIFICGLSSILLYSMRTGSFCFPHGSSFCTWSRGWQTL